MSSRHAIEAELKARLADPTAVRAKLAHRAPPERATYHDIYYDTPAETLTRAGRELRLRTINGARHLLTFKEPPADEASGSKPEYETTLDGAAAMDHLLQALGYARVAEFTKQCVNHRFAAHGRSFLATVVEVPELDGTFLEVETMSTESDLAEALAAVRGVLAELGVSGAELTTELYTGAVRAARGSA